MTPLVAAITASNMNAVQTLLQNGVELDEENANPMHRAVAIGNLEITKLLVQHGVEFENE
ncbi:hypothetical protein AWENTII_007326 [Aspergillus wentii]